jgi:hypothetical protein
MRFTVLCTTVIVPHRLPYSAVAGAVFAGAAAACVR